MGNHSSMWLLLSIYEVFSDSIAYYAHELVVAAFKMKTVVTVWEAVMRISLAYLPIKAANSWFLDVCNQAPLRLPKVWVQKSLTLCWCSFSKWGRECVTFSFAYTGEPYLMYECSQRITTPITQYARPKTVRTPLMLILPQVYPQYVIICFRIAYQ